MNAIRYASGFSGIGGFDLALDRLGFERVWSCDWDPDANRIYYKRFKPEKGTHFAGDIRRVNSENIPDHELFCAGFPCPSYSMAGPRTGFKDQRGEVFFEIPRIAKVKRPKMLLLENVPGLLSHDGGKTFHTILNSLEELGYWIEWQIFNSKCFGVPQTRDRVFIIGHLRGTGGREIFPITKGDRIFDESRTTRSNNQLATTITSNLKRGVHAGGETYIVEPKLKKIGNIAKSGHDSLWGRVYDPEGIAMTLNAEAGGLGAKTGLYAVPARARAPLVLRPKGDWFLQHAVYDPKGYAPTLRGNQNDPSPRTFDSMRIRKLTPIECERLQGFPDGWTRGLSDTARYRVLGNAVTVNVIEFLGKRIMAQFTNKDERK